MSTIMRLTIGFCGFLAAVGAAQAKEVIVRCDVVSLEYAKVDEHALSDPTKTDVRFVEVKIDDTSDFSQVEAKDGWLLSIRGKATGWKDGRLGVDAVEFTHGPEEVPDAAQRKFASSRVFAVGRIDYVGGGTERSPNEPVRERLIFYSAHKPSKTDREDAE